MMNDAELENMLDKAAKRGAQQALKDIGLCDVEAYSDMKEIRNLLDAWRATKQTVGQTVAKVITTAILTALAAGIWMNWGDK